MSGRICCYMHDGVAINRCDCQVSFEGGDCYCGNNSNGFVEMLFAHPPSLGTCSLREYPLASVVGTKGGWVGKQSFYKAIAIISTITIAALKTNLTITSINGNTIVHVATDPSLCNEPSVCPLCLHAPFWCCVFVSWPSRLTWLVMYVFLQGHTYGNLVLT